MAEIYSTNIAEDWCYENQIRAPFTRRQQIGRLLWWIGGFLLFKCSLRPMYAWRRWILRLFGAKIGEQASIQRSARIEFPWNLEIGRYSTIGERAWIFNLGKIKIDDYVTISQRVFLCTGTHDYTRPEFDMITKPIVIKKGTWIAADVFVAPGITIGENAVIGARSVVVKNIPAGMVCVGHPCKPIKPRFKVNSSEWESFL
ncbi:MAG: WcaF family extracellular polysaccharide biosynthesis acetyltransferase [Sedimentisphaerales bacterium]|jgi:putative colanic acid biosynthesis acetyltransferase WcaF